MEENFTKEEKELLLKIKYSYDKIGTISGVAQALNLQPWRVRKYLRKGHWFGLFTCDKLFKRQKIEYDDVEKISYKINLKNIISLFKKYGSLSKVSIQTGIPYYTILSTLKQKLGKNITLLRSEIKRIEEKKKVKYKIDKIEKEIYGKDYASLESAKIMKLLKERRSLSAVSKMTGLPYGYLYRKIINYPQTKKYLHKTNQDNINLQKVIRLMKKYGSLREVAKRLKISEPTLSVIISKKYGIEPKTLKSNVIRNTIFYKGNKIPINLGQVIKLLKKYGSLMKACKELGIPTAAVYSKLRKKFGENILEIKHKILKIRKYKKRILSEEKLLRFKQVKELYERLGTLEKVGKELSLTRERVRQILRDGTKYKVIAYLGAEKIRKAKIEAKGTRLQWYKDNLTREDLVKEIKIERSPVKMRVKLGIARDAFDKLLDYFNIDYEEYHRLSIMGYYLQKYSNIVDTLGHHPSTTEMNVRSDWRSVWGGINRLWGNMDVFRKEFGIEKPKQKIHPSTLVGWEKMVEKRKAIKRERKQRLINFIRDKGITTPKAIREELGLRVQSLYGYLVEFLNDGLIERIGSGKFTEYRIKQT